MDFVHAKLERKNKLSKNKVVKPVESIATIHAAKLVYFQELQDKVLPEKIKKLEKTKDVLTIIKLKQEIEQIKNRQEENDYFLDTMQILQEYFTIQDETSSGVAELDNQEKIEKLNDMIRRYYTAVNMKIPKKFEEDNAVQSLICESCGEYDYQIDTGENYVCRYCGVFCGQIIDYKPNFDVNSSNTPTVVKKVSYKRINYFIEWLNQIQGKEKTDIPSSIIDQVNEELVKQRVSNLANIKPSNIRAILKKTNNSKYYEHIPSIIHRINKLPPLTIPSPIEKRLKFMFKKIQEPWENNKPADRTNFFSYPYTLHKFCQILDLNEYLCYFPLLIDRNKIRKHEITWKKIMNELKDTKSKYDEYDIPWRFVPSI